MDIIELIGDMFKNEDLFRIMGLGYVEIKDKIREMTGFIMKRILHKVVMLHGSMKAMANELMK